MGIGEKIEAGLAGYRRWRKVRARGPLGDFYRAGGARLLFENLPVQSGSVVLDVGGFHGEWTAEMTWRYGCRSIVFEPIPEFLGELAEKFGKNERITLVRAGLAARAGTLRMRIAEDSSSAFGPMDGATVECEMKGVEAVFLEHALTDVACMKLNIEGAEFDVLDEMLRLGLHERISCFLIQFHDVGPQSVARRDTIRAALCASHDNDYDFPFVWERWTRR